MKHKKKPKTVTFKNPWVILSLVVLGLLLIIPKNMSLFSTLKALFTTEQVDYKTLITNGALVIDVRTPSEFSQGHAKGSQNIPLQEFGHHIHSLEGKEVIVVCRSGGRAAQAVSQLREKGIKSYNARAWQNIDF